MRLNSKELVVSMPAQGTPLLPFVPIVYPLISDDPKTQDAYISMRLQGESHNIAEMLATRLTPAVKTDAVFLEGHCNGNQFEDTPWVGDYYRQVARAHGKEVGRGDIYLHQLARFPGDPEGFVKDRSDVQKILESRGWGAEGMVNVKGVEARPDQVRPSVDVAADVVEQRMMDHFDANPDLEHDVARDPQKLEDLFHKCKEEIAPPNWSAESTSTVADLAA